MPLTSKQMREERAPIAATIKQMADKANEEKRDFSPEELPNWEKCNNDYNALTRSIELAERAEKVLADQEAQTEDRSRPLPGRGDLDTRERDQREERENPEDKTPTEEDRAISLQAWFLAGIDKDLTSRHMAAVKKCNVRPHSDHFDFNLRSDVRSMRREFRAMSAVLGASGGFTVPEGFVASLERAMLQFGGMRQVASIMRTDSGNPMSWPTTNDTGNTGALIGENTTVSDQDVAFAQVVFYAHKYSSKQVKIPVELLEDSAFNMAAEVGSMLGERLGRITNTHFTTGSGANQPRGIVTAATLGKTCASATAITMDEVLDLIHSVDPAYRTSAGMMMHDSVLLHIRKLKDGNGQYLWTSGTQAGEPDRIWGYPLTINQDMASSVASAAKTIVFGQLSSYKIRDVAGIRLIRLNERYADEDQVGFLAFLRCDGNLLDAGVAPVKYMVQA